jgi:hypothetical protein
VSKDFDDFKRYFKEYQKRFGLMGFRVYFAYEALEDRFGSVVVDVDTMTAKVSLANDLAEEQKPFVDIKGTAKHEAIHLLLARVKNIALSRYIRDGEFREAEEELVYKLEELISE